jgi:hypothetical protein
MATQLNIPQACLQALQHNEDLSSDDDFKSARSQVSSGIAPSAEGDVLVDERADRVYGLREVKLEGIVVRAAGLGHTRVSELRRLHILLLSLISFTICLQRLSFLSPLTKIHTCHG